LEEIRAKYEEKKNELEGKIMKLKNIGKIKGHNL
jgi:hypothetical protein